MKSAPKSEIHEVKRELEIQTSREDTETITFIIETMDRRALKINFYAERWRSYGDWVTILDGIKLELSRLHAVGQIK